MKQCSVCGLDKPLDDYFKEKRVADGRQAACKECTRQRRRLYRLAHPDDDREYYLKNKERLLTQKKDRYATNDIVRIEYRARGRKYYAEHREAIKARVKEYSLKNQDKIREYQRQLRQNEQFIKAANERSRKYRANPENKAILSHRQAQYTYRKLGAKGSSTKQKLQWRWEYYGGRCWVCEDEAREFDHVIPLTKGGSNWPANLRPICRSCNARKSNKWPYNPKQLLTKE